DKVRIRESKQFRKMVIVLNYECRNLGLPAWQGQVQATTIHKSAGAGIPLSETIQFSTHLPHDFVNGISMKRMGFSRLIQFLPGSRRCAIVMTDICFVPCTHTFSFSNEPLYPEIRSTWSRPTDQ